MDLVQAWAYRNGARRHFIRPEKPVENCFVETFNGKFPEGCLSEHWFRDLDHARGIIASAQRWGGCPRACLRKKRA
jgi:putative transposase